MLDLIAALTGRSRCPWCHAKPPTRIERWMRGDQLLAESDMRTHERAYFAAVEALNTHIPIRRLGRRWHHAHHAAITTGHPRPAKTTR